MQRLLLDLDALVLPEGGQGQDGSSSSSSSSSSSAVLQRAIEAAANAACSAALSPQGFITRLFMDGRLSLVNYLRCVRALARRKFQAKYTAGWGWLPQ